MLRLFVLLACLLWSLTGFGAELAEQMRACLAEQSDAARLACYDALAAGVASPEPVSGPTPERVTQSQVAPEIPASSDKPTAAVPADQVAETVSPAEASFGQPAEKKTPDSILAEISEIDKTAYGKLVLSLTNGQIWRQLDSKRTTLRPGDEIRITSAVSGSFLLSKATGGTSIRVRRIDD